MCTILENGFALTFIFFSLLNIGYFFIIYVNRKTSNKPLRIITYIILATVLIFSVVIARCAREKCMGETEEKNSGGIAPINTLKYNIQPVEIAKEEVKKHHTGKNNKPTNKITEPAPMVQHSGDSYNFSNSPVTQSAIGKGASVVNNNNYTNAVPQRHYTPDILDSVLKKNKNRLPITVMRYCTNEEAIKYCNEIVSNLTHYNYEVFHGVSTHLGFICDGSEENSIVYSKGDPFSSKDSIFFINVYGK